MLEVSLIKPTFDSSVRSHLRDLTRSIQEKGKLETGQPVYPEVSQILADVIVMAIEQLRTRRKGIKSSSTSRE